MSLLALLAAESKWDDGAELKRLLQQAKFHERPRLSLRKFDERAHVSLMSGDDAPPATKRHAA